ncbi:HWE histidine kinase domain-containing protein [Citromicrobium bathyomarinum]|uniref:sensor histidine kinase n=1 Tax=Citromicrobium bathyomarinum TaxID=72174 RepID=UPI00315A0690
MESTFDQLGTDESAPDATGHGLDGRLRKLAEYGIDALEDDPELRAIADFAARLCETPSASVTIVERERQRFLARHGLDSRETPRSVSFCAHAMQGDELFIVPDATKDPRFADNALVTGEEHVRFYAGAPMVTEDGTELGALCVIDTEPRPDGLTTLQAEGLTILARSALRRFVNEREALRSRKQAKERARMLELVLDSVPGIAWSADRDLNFDFYNARWNEVTGTEPPRNVEEWSAHIHPDEFGESLAQFVDATSKKRVFSHEWRLRLADGSYRWALSRAVPIELPDGDWRWFGTIIDIDDVHRLSESRDLLARELSHRIKNIFAVVASLITLSARRDPQLRYFAAEMTDKIAALGRAHEFVAPTGMNDVRTLHGLLEQIFAPYSDGDGPRVSVSGENPAIHARAATPLALVFHELATNSAKYGVLSREEDGVAVSVSLPDPTTLRIQWHEPGVEQEGKASEGFGSRLLRMSVEGQLQGKIDREWTDDGLVVTLDLSLPVLAG